MPPLVIRRQEGAPAAIKRDSAPVRYAWLKRCEENPHSLWSPLLGFIIIRRFILASLRNTNNHSWPDTDFLDVRSLAYTLSFQELPFSPNAISFPVRAQGVISTMSGVIFLLCSSCINKCLWSGQGGLSGTVRGQALLITKLISNHFSRS